MRNIKVNSGIVPAVIAGRAITNSTTRVSPVAKQWARAEAIFAPLPLEEAEAIMREVRKDDEAPSELVIISLLWGLANEESQLAFSKSMYLVGTLRRYMERRGVQILKDVAEL